MWRACDPTNKFHEEFMLSELSLLVPMICKGEKKKEKQSKEKLKLSDNSS